MNQRYLLALIAAVVWAGCTSPSTTPNPTTARTTVIRGEIQSDPDTLDFTRFADRHSRRVSLLISDSLIGLSASLRYVPRVAESWEVSADGRDLVFHLRHDARWHDGRPVTSADVLHTWKLMRDPAVSAAPRAIGFTPIKRVDVIDPHTVRIHYDERFNGALDVWATNPLIPAHVPLSAENPLGCGPWKLIRWEPGARLIFKANHDHFEPPHADELRLEVIREPATRFAALKAGELDISGLHPAQVPTARTDPALQARFEIRSSRTLYFFYIAWRLDGSNPFFGDPRVRQAMTLGIDRQAYINAVGHGMAEVGITSWVPDLPYFDRTVTAWPYDPRRASELLDAAGWVRQGSSATRHKGRQEFRFTLTYSKNSDNDRLAAFIQSQLMLVGVGCELDPVDPANFLARLRSTRFQAIMSGMASTTDPDPFDQLHSTQAKAGGQNYSGLVDAEIDRLIERGRESSDEAQRTDCYSRLQHRVHELEPVTVLLYPMTSVAISRRLSGVELSAYDLWQVRPGPSQWVLAPDAQVATH